MDKLLITAVSKKNNDDVLRLIQNGSNPIYCTLVSYNIISVLPTLVGTGRE